MKLQGLGPKWAGANKEYSTLAVIPVTFQEKEDTSRHPSDQAPMLIALEELLGALGCAPMPTSF